MEMFILVEQKIVKSVKFIKKIREQCTHWEGHDSIPKLMLAQSTPITSTPKMSTPIMSTPK